MMSKCLSTVYSHCSGADVKKMLTVLITGVTDMRGDVAHS